jgi:hypothetical protein
MIVFLKVKNIDILLNNTLWIYRIKILSFLIGCAIKFYINIINTLFVYRLFVSFKIGLKCVPNFFYLILSEPLSEPLPFFRIFVKKITFV